MWRREVWGGVGREVADYARVRLQNRKRVWCVLAPATTGNQTCNGISGRRRRGSPGPHLCPCGECWGGVYDWATSGFLVSAREMLLGRVLLAALERHHLQSRRAVWSWPERDKLSAQFLLHLPGHSSTLTPEEFSECMAALLCLPSPACQDKLGEVVGRRKVDLYGDNVVGQRLPGDGWQHRHKDVKDKILYLLRWAGVEVRCEVFNLFAGLIP